MARLIYCYECGLTAKRFEPTREDKQLGWKSRVQFGMAKCPEDHSISMTEIDFSVNLRDQITRKPGFNRTRLDCLKCDLCGNSVPDGTLCVGITEWRGDEPSEWEPEYMDVVAYDKWRETGRRIKAVRERLLTAKLEAVGKQMGLERYS